MLRHRRSGLGSRRRLIGATLIEVLISVLLAAIGLLALAGANVASIRYSKMAQYRGTATMLAADLAERMRANQAGLAGYAVATDFDGQATEPAANTACEGYTATCNSADLATYDKAIWQRLVRSRLPQGSVFVTPSTAAVLAADVWVAWRDPAVASPSENNTDARNTTTECPASYSSDESVRCIYFRINI